MAKYINWKSIVARYLYDRQGGRCMICNRKIIYKTMVEIQCIVPGKDFIDNFLLIHRSCHEEINNRKRKVFISDLPMLNTVKVIKREADLNILRHFRKLRLDGHNIKTSAAYLHTDRQLIYYLVKKYQLKIWEYKRWNLN